MDFISISPEIIRANLFHNIGKDWLLICCNDAKNARQNMMTASWGGMGILWNLPVCFLFVRPQRYTHTLLQKEKRFSVCVLPKSLHGAHGVCGSHSGRDTDKVAATGLTECVVDGVKAIQEAELLFIVKQLYVDRLDPSCFVDNAVLHHYPEEDFHSVYICEIEKVYAKTSETDVERKNLHLSC